MNHPRHQTLQEYLQAEIRRKGQTDFSLRVSSVGDKLRFYVYPSRVDGNTADFELTGNNLVTTAVTDYARVSPVEGETFG